MHRFNLLLNLSYPNWSRHCLRCIVSQCIEYPKKPTLSLTVKIIIRWPFYRLDKKLLLNLSSTRMCCSALSVNAHIVIHYTLISGLHIHPHIFVFNIIDRFSFLIRILWKNITILESLKPSQVY